MILKLISMICNFCKSSIDFDDFQCFRDSIIVLFDFHDFHNYRIDFHVFHDFHNYLIDFHNFHDSHIDFLILFVSLIII